MPRARKAEGASPKRARKQVGNQTVLHGTEITAPAHKPGGGFAPGHPWAWKPGQSGNPGGRPKTTTAMRERAASLTDLAMDVQELAMQIGKAKMERALAILRDPDAPFELLKWAGDVIEAGALVAANTIMDRGHGKAAPPPPSRANIFDAMTEEEIQNYVVKGASEVVEGITAKRKRGK